ncbi:MAG: hypothetical protein AAF996_11835, partial [Pseudomonadota bacterium]
MKEAAIGVGCFAAVIIGIPLIVWGVLNVLAVLPPVFYTTTPNMDFPPSFNDILIMAIEELPALERLFPFGVNETQVRVESVLDGSHAAINAVSLFTWVFSFGFCLFMILVAIPFGAESFLAGVGY